MLSYAAKIAHVVSRYEVQGHLRSLLLVAYQLKAGMRLGIHE